MTANRIIPYGYAVESGKTIIQPDEHNIIRRIYRDYLGGVSLLKIAQALTAYKVEFLPGRSDWNKNRVKRILEDERYLGTDTYPAIIDADMYRQAQTLKDSNNTQNRTADQRTILNKSEIPYRLPCSVECILCGTKMSRRHDSRRKASKDLWTCQNPDCRKIVNIDDDILYREITMILNRLIADPSLIRQDIIPIPDTPLEVRRLTNEVDRELDSFEFDKDKTKKAIFALSAEKYRHIDNRQHKTYVVRAEFEKSELLSCFLSELFKRTVLKVQLGDNGVLWCNRQGFEHPLQFQNEKHIQTFLPGYGLKQPLSIPLREDFTLVLLFLPS